VKARHWLGLFLLVCVAFYLVRNHGDANPAPRVRQPAYSVAACSADQTWTWYYLPDGNPVLCGHAPPSDTGNWGAGLPGLGGDAGSSSASASVPASRPAPSGCPATFCSPNPNPPVPAARNGLP
jgi:hypothetical protein